MIIVSGPSTIGKNPFIYKACSLFNYNYIIPYTTRAIRSDEVDGRDYHFLLKEEFQHRIQTASIRDWDYCLQNYYGYVFDFPGEKGLITHGLSRLALRLKYKYPHKITTVFLMPYNIESINENLKMIYSGTSLILRQALVEEEICHSALFDQVYTVSNSVFELFNKQEVVNVFHAER